VRYFPPDSVVVGRYRLTFEEAGARLDRLDEPPAEAVRLALAPPSAPPLLVGRSEAVQAARAHRGTRRRGVAFVGPSGCGKTTLLAALADDPVIRDSYEAVLSFDVAAQPWEDVLAQIYRRLQPAGAPRALPASHDWLAQIDQRRIALLLDDIDPPFELEPLLRVLPQATAFVTAREPHPELRTRRLSPLSDADALWLFSSWTNVLPLERDNARAICALAKGNPARLRQLATLATTRGLATLAREAPSEAALAELLRANVARLDPRQRGLFDAIGVFGPDVVAQDDPGALRLAADGLITAAGGGWRIAPGFEGRFAPAEETTFRSGMNACGATLAAGLADVEDPSRLHQAIAATARAGELERFGDVIVLGKAAGEVLARTGAWRQWRTVLDLISAAAGRTGAESIQSWVLHQSGTRLAALGETSDAQSMLRVAYARRKAAGERAAAKLTRHNLEIIAAPQSPKRGVLAASIAAAAALVLLAAFSFRLYNHRDAQSQAVLASRTSEAVAATATPRSTPHHVAPHARQRKPHQATQIAALPHTTPARVVATRKPSAAPETAKPSAVPATPKASAAPASPQPSPPAPSPEPSTAAATPAPSAPLVALAPHSPATRFPPVQTAAHFKQPEILAFGVSKPLVAAGATTRLCMNVRDATRVRLTATSGASTRVVTLPAAVRRGLPACIRIAPSANTRYELHATSGPKQAFRIQAVDVFQTPAAQPQSESTPTS